MFKTFLVAVDFSETSLAALEAARELARATQAELVLLHADEFPVVPVGDPYLPAHVIEEHQQWVKRRLEEFTARAREGGTKVRACSIVGPAHQVIVDAATADAADLIVMGTHGRRGFRRLLAGSVTERVVRLSKVPVLAVRLDEERARRSA